MSLFEDSKAPKPLAERLRPRSLDQVLGQDEAKRMLEAFTETGDMPSMVMWGPPGTGKTTLSRLMATLLNWEGRTLNATSASVKDIREMAAEAKEMWTQLERRTLLFVDEIHRLNKNQQDVLLPIVEAGTLILAGSTTENPFFSLNQALRSRVQLVQLSPLAPENVVQGLVRAQTELAIHADKEAVDWIAIRVAGDLRLAYTTLETAAIMARVENRSVTLDDAMLCLTQTQVSGDRKGDNHFDLASAFQKSLRGSDANAAIYYMVRFLETGEDPRFIARRLLVTASEDVGNADPRALLIASAAAAAVASLGLPECRIPLAQAVLYVARAPKSNEAVSALMKATTFLRSRSLDPIPPHLRDAHYKGAKSLGHGEGYIYSHDAPQASQTFLPDNIAGELFVATRPTPASKDPVKTPKQAPVDPADLASLADFLAAEFGSGEGFEIDASALAQKIGWTEQRLRQTLNKLVADHKLTFKRLFRLMPPK